MVTKKGIKNEIENILMQYRLSPVNIILFGSRAKKNFTSDSDWDILIVIKEDIEPFERKIMWYRVYKALHKKFSKFSFDVFIKSENEFNSEKSIVNTISNEASVEGKAL
jgi:predicted nucleotidyltransferase